MKNNNSIVLGGGCFWCTEAIFQNIKGVISVVPGYAGGTTENPTYQDVAGQKTGHAEVIKVDFDQNIVTYRDLLEVFFSIHDPTTLNRQGYDTGPEYRSIILYANDEQKQTAVDIITELTEAHAYTNPIVTEVAPLTKFYEAEEEHKNYYNNNKDRNPYCTVIINPKLKKFKEKFHSLLKDST